MKEEDEKSRKEIGVRTVVRWILIGLAVLISVSSGIAAIEADQFFLGLLFFALVVFIFVPRKHLRITKYLKVVIFILAYFTLVTIAGLTAPTPEPEYRYYNLGESFNLTHRNNVFSMNVNNVSTENQLIVDGENVTTSGTFLIVDGNIKNLGKSPLDFDFDTLQPELRDNEDNLYTLAYFSSFKSKLQPKLETKFSTVFEIPKGSSGLKFIVKDETDIIKIVNLGR